MRGGGGGIMGGKLDGVILECGFYYDKVFL